MVKIAFGCSTIRSFGTKMKKPQGFFILARNTKCFEAREFSQKTRSATIVSRENMKAIDYIYCYDLRWVGRTFLLVRGT